MMIRIIKITNISLIGFFLTMNASLAADQNDLYKWQDASGKWHYSKVPPAATEETPQKIAVAKDTRTIIFEEQKNTVTLEDKVAAQQQAKQKRADCQVIRSSIRDTAFYLRKTTDKDFQEKNLTKEEYEQTHKFIIKLEDTSSNINFDDICMDDFLKEPQTKAIANCVKENTTLETRTSCLKELSAI